MTDTREGLYPIIRRIRRPLVETDAAKAAVVAQVQVDSVTAKEPKKIGRTGDCIPPKANG